MEYGRERNAVLIIEEVACGGVATSKHDQHMDEI